MEIALMTDIGENDKKGVETAPPIKHQRHSSIDHWNYFQTSKGHVTLII